MNILVVGGAGYVASIIRPALEAEHECKYFDRRPVPGRSRQTIVGDVLDSKIVARAVRRRDAIVYLALGASTGRVNRKGYRDDVSEIRSAFAINVGAFYGFVYAGLEAGVRKFVYASTLNVYDKDIRETAVSERNPTNAWGTYGLSKRCGEMVCEAAAQHCPEAVVISLRLYGPKTAEHFRIPPKRHRPGMLDARLGPEDTSKLFLAALACNRPGAHMIQASGDVKEERYSHARARRILGWRPVGH